MRDLTVAMDGDIVKIQLVLQRNIEKKVYASKTGFRQVNTGSI